MNKKLKHTPVTVVIPSYNCKKILFRLLNSIKKSSYKNLYTIVVDNGSKDGTLQIGKIKYPWVKWIDAGEKNIGQTGSYNLGFANAKKGSHIVMIDSDVVVDKKMIQYLVDRVESDDNIGITTPMVLYLCDKNWVNQAGSEVNLKTGKATVGWGPKKNFMKAKEVQGSGTVMLFKNELVKKIGGFEDWFMCYFDPEYCLRAKKAGYTCWYEPRAVCYHDQSKDPGVWGPRVLGRAYLLGRNRTLFMRKHGDLLYYVLFSPILISYYLWISIKYNILGKWIDLLRGTLDGFFYQLNTKSTYVPLKYKKILR